MRSRKGRSEPLRGTLAAPGDKSISHRALVLSALADGASTIEGLNVGADVAATAAALRGLGVGVGPLTPGAAVAVESRGAGSLHEPEDVIDAGNSGTTMRTLLGVLAAVDGSSVVTGDASLRRRPMLRVVAPLRQMGAAIDGRDHGNLAPLVIRGRALAGVDIETTVPSAQVKTAVLLAGLRAAGTTSVTEPAPSRDHTERMLAACGVRVERAGTRVALHGPQSPEPAAWSVPGDLSSVMFLVAAALLVEGSELEVTGVGLNPTRTAALDVLQRMGAEVAIGPTTEVSGEPVGDLTVRASRLRGVTIAPEEVPALIDEIPVLAVLASQAEGETVVRGAGELRVKESDRIARVVEGLRALGAAAEELPDGMVVTGPSVLGGGVVDSAEDHRIALSFAVAGLVARERVRVHGWSAVETSFPEFLELLGRAQGKR